MPPELINVPPVSLVTTTSPGMVPALARVALLFNVTPIGMVFVPASVHDAPLSTVRVAISWKLVPRPVSVPVLPPEASSSMPLPPSTVPLNTAPGSITSKFCPTPAKSTAKPPRPHAMVPAFVTVPAEFSTTPLMRPLINAEAALMTEPPLPRRTPSLPVPKMLPELTTVPPLAIAIPKPAPAIEPEAPLVTEPPALRKTPMPPALVAAMWPALTTVPAPLDM